jgi:ribosomal protein S18 acetylase RimI-like enzyme
MIRIVDPKKGPMYEDYLYLRWLLLREPLGGERGSELDDMESVSYHRAIVSKDNDIIGVGRVHFRDSLAQIRYMGVEHSHSRMGYGTKLLHTLEKIVDKHGINKIFLNSRINAIAFYQKNGYSKIKRVEPSFGDIIHYRMEKIL